MADELALPPHSDRLLVAVYGAWIVTPLGWEMAGLVWGYAIGWFLLTDPVKLLAYRVLDHFATSATLAVESKPRADGAALSKGASPAGPIKADALPKPATAASPVPKGDKADGKTAPVPATPVLATSQKPAAASTSNDSKAAAGFDPVSQPETASKPTSAPAAKPDAVPAISGQAATPAKVIALLDRKLGDVLVEAVLTHPGEAGRLITEAITDAEASPAIAKPLYAKPADAAPPAPKAAE